MHMAQHIRHCRDELNQVAQILLNPAAGPMLLCQAGLERAVGWLMTAQSSLAELGPGSQPATHHEIHELKADLVRVNTLLQQAANLQMGWTQLVAGTAGTYTQRGEQEPATALYRVAFRG